MELCFNVANPTRGLHLFPLFPFSMDELSSRFLLLPSHGWFIVLCFLNLVFSNPVALLAVSRWDLKCSGSKSISTRHRQWCFWPCCIQPATKAGMEAWDRPFPTPRPSSNYRHIYLVVLKFLFSSPLLWFRPLSLQTTYLIYLCSPHQSVLHTAASDLSKARICPSHFPAAGALLNLIEDLFHTLAPIQSQSRLLLFPIGYDLETLWKKRWLYSFWKLKIFNITCLWNSWTVN